MFRSFWLRGRNMDNGAPIVRSKSPQVSKAHVNIKQNGGHATIVLSLRNFQVWYLELYGIDRNGIFFPTCTKMVQTQWCQILVVPYRPLYGVAYVATGLVASRRQRLRARAIEVFSVRSIMSVICLSSEVGEGRSSNQLNWYTRDTLKILKTPTLTSVRNNLILKVQSIIMTFVLSPEAELFRLWQDVHDAASFLETVSNSPECHIYAKRRIQSNPYFPHFPWVLIIDYHSSGGQCWQWIHSREHLFLNSQMVSWMLCKNPKQHCDPCQYSKATPASSCQVFHRPQISHKMSIWLVPNWITIYPDTLIDSKK